jgi:hypothetical protein
LRLARMCSARSAPKHAPIEFASIPWRRPRDCRQCAARPEHFLRGFNENAMSVGASKH